MEFLQLCVSCCTNQIALGADHLIPGGRGLLYFSIIKLFFLTPRLEEIFLKQAKQNFFTVEHKTTFFAIYINLIFNTPF